MMTTAKLFRWEMMDGYRRKVMEMTGVIIPVPKLCGSAHVIPRRYAAGLCGCLLAGNVGRGHEKKRGEPSWKGMNRGQHRLLGQEGRSLMYRESSVLVTRIHPTMWAAQVSRPISY